MCHSSVYSYHLLISSAPVMPLPFLSFILPILAWNIPLISLIFLKRSLVYPITLLSYISLHCSLKKPFLPFLVILWNSAFKCVYLSFCPLLFASLLFTAICQTPQTKILPFCISLSWGWSWSLSLIQRQEPPSIVLQVLCPSDLIPWIYLSLPLWFRSYLNGLMAFPTFFSLSLNLAIRSSWSESQSAPSLVFAGCIELLHLQLQGM